MKTVFEKRRAERFAQLLDEANGGRRHHSRSRLDDQLAELVAVGRQLSDVPAPGAIRPEFRRDLRAQLMATAERDGIGVTAVEPESGSRAARPSRTRIAVFAGVAAGALAISSVSVASGDAKPGDTLYGVKRSTERAQLALASSDLGRGQLYLEFARTRLGEAHAVRRDDAGFAAALTDMDADTMRGVRLLLALAADRQDTTPLRSLDSFVDDQRMLVRQLSVLVDGESVQRVNSSLALLTTIQARSHALRLAIGCGVGATGRVDDFGPVAAACPSPTGSAPEIKTQTATGTSQPKPPAVPDGEATPAPSIAPSATPSPVPSTEADDGGLLGDLGRLLGGILGG